MIYVQHCKHQQYGLSLYIEKCKITALEKATVENIPETREFTFTPLSDLTLLGAPVTTGAALDKILKAKTDDLAKAFKDFLIYMLMML